MLTYKIGVGLVVLFCVGGAVLYHRQGIPELKWMFIVVGVATLLAAAYTLTTH